MKIILGNSKCDHREIFYEFVKYFEVFNLGVSLLRLTLRKIILLKN